MRDTRVLTAYFMREISAKAESFKGLPLPEALKKASDELRPEIEASVQSNPNLSPEEKGEVVKLLFA